ncbi:hypothetical protein A2714_02735 [Candidatus Woesebacteria bacterium RIFCSPHIGHO2_01_FULL_38_9]|uniref:Regulatory protein RecX n=2 Tax=Candidatus Woeseibacteriota TaxID=1752722 RepID=A0A1F7Y294_9BACT|nr:MAG: hypothetical protein A2714_02735 [Candidatus Woesebacteria bacterium RIFCSPHIGHO2_01_FULL_38_9]OGM60380.1 MAG: hypothetical protein A3A75_04000 [Candidatus Woesebacteria bacterium RIFCSPLOWO2_01_FULL_39_10]
MPQITAIKPQKNQKRVNIYLDDKFGFGLDLENFLKLGLKVEQELSDAEVAEIIKKAEFQKTYDKILRFASLRPRSEKEYKNWLRKHKIHSSLHQEVFNRLKRLDFLNDKRFAVWWVDQRKTFKPKGVRALNFELRQKGIDRKVIDEVLSESGVDEEVEVRKLISKYKYKWEKISGLEKRKKVSEFLLRRGFGWEIIRKVLVDLRDNIDG